MIKGWSYFAVTGRDSDYPAVRHRHLFIGGPLNGEHLSEEEYFQTKERGYIRYNRSFKGVPKAVWIYHDQLNIKNKKDINVSQTRELK